MHCWTPFASTLVSMKAAGITNKQWLRVATWQPAAIAWWREWTPTSWPFFTTDARRYPLHCTRVVFSEKKGLLALLCIHHPL